MPVIWIYSSSSAGQEIKIIAEVIVAPRSAIRTNGNSCQNLSKFNRLNQRQVLTNPATHICTG